jgi:hypothetical protein
MWTTFTQLIVWPGINSSQRNSCVSPFDLPFSNMSTVSRISCSAEAVLFFNQMSSSFQENVP